MRQIFFYLPIWHIPIYGYGVMLVVGFVAAMYLAQYLARRSTLDPDIFANAAIIGLVAGVVGARLSHVLENFSYYTRSDITAWQNLYNAINIREGGLTYYGGFLLAFPSMVLYGVWKKVPILRGMDIVAPCLMIGLAFGRIGCYVNGCCYGASCNLPWAVEFPYGSDAYITQFAQNQLKRPVPRELIRDNSALGQYMEEQRIPMTQIQEPVSREVLREIDMSTLKPRDQIQKEAKTVFDAQGRSVVELAKLQHAEPVHPAEIYSSITAFLIAAFLLAYLTVPHTPGRVFAAMMMIEGVFRYVLEMLRVEPAVIGRGTHVLSFLPPQSYSMVVAFFLVDGGLILWVLFGRRFREIPGHGFPIGRPAAA